MDITERAEGLKIWTVGHSTRELADFIALLRANEIEAIADVRSLPGSRKFPQFNSEELEPSLADAGIDYKLIKQLGGRRKALPDSPHTVWRHKSFRGYADYMDTPGFEEGIEILLDLAEKKKTAVMCAEAVWWRCHRSMIADYLKSFGATIEHIMGENKNVIHPFPSAASLEKGRLFYGEG